MAPVNSSLKPSLLLLSSPPNPATAVSLHAAYHTPISHALARLPPSTPHLTIVLAASFHPLRWAHLQSLLAGLYSLIASLTDTHDVRIVLVDHVRGRDYPADRIVPFNDSTVPDLGTFAEQKHRFEAIYHPSSETGYELLSTFLRAAERHQTFFQKQLIALPGGLSFSHKTNDQKTTTAAASAGTPAAPAPQDRLYSGVCLGGTFDHLHFGHKLLLHAATLLVKLPRQDEDPATLIVGISGDALLKNKKFADEMESWPIRARSVFSFLSTILSSPTPNVENRKYEDNEEFVSLYCSQRLKIRCANIVDVFGPTITEEHADAIVLSGETRGGGSAINERRVGKGWSALEVFEIDVLDASQGDEDSEKTKEKDDFSSKISSTEIRRRKAERKTQSAKLV